MNEVFIGSEAIAAGRLTEHELRRWYRPTYRDVYLPKSVDPSLRDRTRAAWLWSKRRGVIADDRPDDILRQVREAIRRRSSPRSTVA